MGTVLDTMTRMEGTLVPLDQAWPEEARAVIERMEEGKTYSDALLACSSHPGKLKRAMAAYMDSMPALRACVEKLESENADAFLDEIIDIADNAEMTSVGLTHAKLRIDTRVTLATMRNKRYKKGGDTTVNIGVMEGPKFVFVGMEPDNRPVIDVTPSDAAS
jgi:hypothetical protein